MRPVQLRIAGRTLVTNAVNIAVAVTFAVTGGFVIYLASAQTMTRGPAFQVAIGSLLAGVFARIQAWTAPVPEPLLGLVVLGIAGLFVYATLADRRPVPPQPTPERAAVDADPPAVSDHCHHHSTTAERQP